MGGKRIFNFREGDRSEYLAQFMLSRFAYVYGFQRQEDFGVADFLCILSQVQDNKVYPETGFYVQVKSDEKDIQFDKDAVRWISLHMDLPLMICVINKKQSKIKLYSCSKIWAGMFAYHLPERLQIILNKGTNSQYVDINKKEKYISVEIGEPILSMTIDEVENNPNKCYEILKPWLELDKMNLARRSIGRIFSTGYLNWKPNEAPKGYFNQYTFGNEFEKAEKDIANILTALCGSYRGAKQKERLDDLINLLKHYENYLDAFGKEFIENKFERIDDILKTNRI